ncbi:MAG: TlpA family protein disulfide reductase [Rhodospirillales bacterium]|nr:TlpA family protein disulfide reductase [Rhodospirillales bacterium]
MTAEASTPNTRIAVRTASGRYNIRVFVAAFMSCFFVFAPSLRAAPDQCTPQNGLFGNFQATRPAQLVPDVTFLQETGAETTLAAHKGKGVVLNFWATWCAPCVREMPQLDRLNAFVRENRIDVLTISEDRKALVAAPKFYKTHNLNDLPVLADPQGRLMRAFSAPGLPLTVFINSAGFEIGRVIGPAEWDSPEIVSFVRQCLSPAPPSEG